LLQLWTRLLCSRMISSKEEYYFAPEEVPGYVEG